MIRKSIKCICTENPEQWIWTEYMLLQNEETARRYLIDAYSRRPFNQPDRLAYRNVPAFTSYINQATSLIKESQTNHPWVRPILLYYGMMSMLKAWLLTRIPDYPQNTAVLRHGLSTRKRKRERFRFCEDEIKIQREGLFPLVAEEWNLPPMTGESYTAKELFSFIPDLHPTYHRLFQQKSLARVFFTRSGAGLLLHVPEQVLDHFHLSAERLVDKLNQARHGLFSLSTSRGYDGYLTLHCACDEEGLSTVVVDNPLPPHPGFPSLSTTESLCVSFHHPWFYENKKGDLYLWLGNDRPVAPLPEILVHLMLLFSLSMLCRYDPPLWGEIMLDNQQAEQIIIHELLELVPRKFAQLMLTAFAEEKLILRAH
ncbi:YaaC family protein [Laceyella putida]|uniref:YaaC family protein n=1 Tax=Laceyella putida TaxID=110101 RepID=A0ABW2RGR3_9BACL